MSLFLALALLAAPHTPSETTFTEAMAARFRKALPSATFEVVGPLTIAGRQGQQQKGTINLDRVFQFCGHNSAEDCDAMKQEFVDGIIESSFSGQSQDATRDRLRIAVRADDYCSEIDALMQHEGQSTAIWKPLVEGLCAIMTVDSPRSLRMANVDDLKTVGLEREAAWTLARAQTLDGLPKVIVGAGKDRSKGAVLGGEDYTATLMLADAEWTALAAADGVAPLAAVPEARILILLPKTATSSDIASVRATLVEQQKTAERAVSSQIYRWTAKGWEVAR